MYDPDCYRLLYERLLLEEGEAERRRIERAKVNQMHQQELSHVKLHKALDKRKEKRLKRETERAAAQREDKASAEHLKQLQEEMEQNLAAKERRKAEHGVWRKDELGHWEFCPKVYEPRNASVLYTENRKVVTDAYERNKAEGFQQTWKKVTTDGELEVPWKRADPFILPDIRLQLQQQQQRLLIGSSGGSIGSADGVDSQARTLISRDGKPAVDIEYRDENDAELEGEDIDDLICALGPS